MAKTFNQDKLLLMVGVVGIFALAIGAMGYAIWKSASRYDLEQIEQFVQEKSAEEVP